jgi:hypothetical protein
VDQITNGSRGVWSIETISGSSYLLDLDSRVLLRQADPFASEDGTLRRDGDPIQLSRLVHCEVGDNMLLLVNLSVLTWCGRPGFPPGCSGSRVWTPGT